MKKPRRVFMQRNKRTGVTKIRRVDYTENWAEIALEVKKRDGFQCRKCTSTDRLEVHHIIPLSRGGTNAKRNLITLCWTCHNKKHKHMHDRK